MKRTLTVMLALAIGLALAAAGAVAWVNSDHGARWVSARASEAVGSEVAIADLSVTPGRLSRVRLSGLRVANAASFEPSDDGTSPPWLADIASLEVVIDTMALLAGDVVLESIQVAAPDIRAQRAANGSSNWPTASKQQDASAGSLPRIESLSVTQGELHYHDLPGNALFDVRVDTNGAGAVSASGSGRVAGQPLELSLRGSALASAAADLADSGYPLDLEVTSGDAQAHFDGVVLSTEEGPAVRGGLAAQASDLRRWLQLTGAEGAEGAPAIGDKQASLDARIDASAREVVVALNHATAAGSDLAGRVTVNLSASPVVIEAQLQSRLIDATPWLAQQGRGDEDAINRTPEPSPPQGDTPVVNEGPTVVVDLKWMHSVNGTIALAVERIDGLPVALSDLDLSASVDPTQVGVDVTHVKVMEVSATAQASLEREDKLGSGQQSVSIDASASVDAVALEAFAQGSQALRDAASNAEGSATFNVALRGTIDGQQRATFSELQALRADVDLAAPAAALTVAATLRADTDSGAAKALRLTADGVWHDLPLVISATAPTPQALLAQDATAPLPLEITVSLGEATLDAAGAVAPGWPPTSAEAEVHLTAPSVAALAAVVAPEASTSDLGALELRAVVSSDVSADGEARQVMLKDVALAIDQTRVTANVSARMASDATHIDATLRSPRLDVRPWLAAEQDQTPVPGDSQTATPATALEPINLPDGLSADVDIDVDELLVPTQAFEDAAVDLRLRTGRVLLDSASVAFAGGKLAARGHVELTTPGFVGGLRLEASAIDVEQVLAMQGVDPTAREALAGTIDGLLSLTLPGPRLNAAGQVVDGARADIIERIQIESLQASYDDPDLRRKADLRLTATDWTSPVRINGKIEVDAIPFDIDARLGSLRAFTSGTTAVQASSVDATISTPDRTALRVRGSLGELTNVDDLRARVSVRGRSLAALGLTLGVELPDLPPYTVEGRLLATRQDSTYVMEDLVGQVGDSDLRGRLRISLAESTPYVAADLRSRLLDLDDLAGLIGGTPDPDETASSTQRRAASANARRARVLPDTPLALDALRAANADIRYRAKAIDADGLPFNDVVADLALRNAVVRIDRLDFGVAQGTVAFDGELDATTSPPKMNVDADFDGLRLGKLLRQLEDVDDALGKVGGRAKVWLQGDSVANLMASADGGVFVTMTGGRLDTLLIELAGLDFAESLSALLGSESEVTIDCAYIDMQARGGVVEVKPLLFDTADTKFRGDGDIDLRNESLDLTVVPYPKDFSLLSSRGPLTIGGTFASPRFRVSPSFPSPEFGQATDSARCQGLASELRRARKRTQ